jgi:hypothetical protein
MKLPTVFVLSTLGLTAFAAPSSAAVISTSVAAVSQYRTHDTDIYPGELTDWFTLTGVTSLGTCGTIGGAVIFKIREGARAHRMHAMVQASLLKGLTLKVYVDDAVKDGNYCIVSYMSVYKL